MKSKTGAIEKARRMTGKDGVPRIVVYDPEEWQYDVMEESAMWVDGSTISPANVAYSTEEDFGDDNDSV